MESAPHETGLADRVLPRGNPLHSVHGGESRRQQELTRTRPLALRAPTQDRPHSPYAELHLEDLWNRHGSSLYALACTLLGDEAAAMQAVMQGMTDLAHSTESVSAEDARRSMARHVYWRSQELAGETSRTLHLPPAMVWLGQLAQLQRGCLALCVFGGHTHREAAGLLGVPPVTVAELLTSGLREVGRLAADRTATSA